MQGCNILQYNPQYGPCPQAMYERMLEHQREWSADRGVALAIRRALEQADSSAIYECDDKCGSFWQSLPVEHTGRDGKSVAEMRTSTVSQSKPTWFSANLKYKEL